MSDVGAFGPEFLLERERYEADFAELLGQSFEPRTLYQFPIYLPFHIAFETAETLCISREGQSVLFFFSDIEVSAGLVLDMGALSGSGPAITRRTRVEMVFVTSDVHAHENQFATAFDECLEALNTAIIAYMLVKKDFRLHRVTRDMFQAACITRIVHLPSWQVERGLLALHTQVPYVAPGLSASELPEFQRNIQIIASKLNPFVEVLELQFAALRQLRSGDCREAVLSALSAAEAMLGALFVELLRIE